MEERAKEAATEVNGLLEEAGALELDMKTTVLAFDNLTRKRFTEHASGGSNLLCIVIIWIALFSIVIMVAAQLSVVCCTIDYLD